MRNEATKLEFLSVQTTKVINVPKGLENGVGSKSTVSWADPWRCVNRQGGSGTRNVQQ